MQQFMGGVVADLIRSKAADVDVKAGPNSKTTVQDAMGVQLANSTMATSTSKGGMGVPEPSWGIYTVGDHFSNTPGMSAWTPIGMGTIWIDPTHARFAAANSTPAELQGLVMHELIHNTLGLYDDQIQERLGLKVQKDSSNITQALTATCVNGAGNF